MPGRTGGTSSGGGSSSHSSSSHSSSSSSHSYYRSSSSSGDGSSNGSWGAVVVLGAIFVILLLMMSSGEKKSDSAGDWQAKATTAADIAIMEKGILPRLTEWRSEQDDQVHHVHYEVAGLPANFNTKEVVYGYCASKQFYVYVLNLDPGFGLSGTADSSGYAYLTSSTPYACAPTGWRITGSETANASWYYVNIDTKAATATAGASSSPTPH
jgi:hypothetical protein